MIPLGQAEVAAFLQGLAGAVPVETHISAVFRGADTVWKLKKAVRLPFLDFSRLEDRRRFLLRELALNAPYAPGLYRDVAAIVRGPGGLEFGAADAAGSGGAIDWVLRMARVPDGDFMDQMALTPALLDATADAVAEMHAALPAVVVEHATERLRQVALGNGRSAIAAGLPPDAVHGWQKGMLATLDARAELIDGRAAAGFVRRAHGDLHLGNLLLWHGRPAPFDALEFDEDLATIDLGYDLAFLLMDLERRVSRAAANRVLGRYVGRNGDAALVGLLTVFLSMRAMVRAHVEASRGNGGLDYLDAAMDALRPAPPMVLAIGGLMGTGKTTLARALAPEIGPAPGALVLRSDEVRKRLEHVRPEDRLPPSAYTAVSHQRTDAALLDNARDAIGGGHAVVVDATFLDPALRGRVAAVAHAAGAPFLGLWLHAPPDELEHRVAARLGDASDATVAVLRAVAGVAPAADWRHVEASDAAATLREARLAVEKLEQRC